jgi:5-methylthioadenosine/S-adenosylhomocysteine deaminase
MSIPNRSIRDSEHLMKPNFRITGARIASLTSVNDMLDAMDLWVADGRIAAIAPAGAAAPFNRPYDTYEFTNALVLPGLVNAHTHSSSSLLRGTAPGAPLDLYTMELMSRRAPRTMEQVRVSVLLHAIEMLKRGITGVIDHFRSGAVPSIEAVSTVLQAYDDIGMRAVVAPMFEDKRYIDSLPIDQSRLPPALQEHWRHAMTPSPESYFAMMEDVVATWRDRERLHVMLGVDGPQRCTPRLLEMTGDFAARHGVGLHTHLLEAKTQLLMAPSEFDGSFVAYLDHFGLIGPKSSLAHFVWCTDLDIELAADKRVNVINNPVSNLLLGSGLQPTRRLLESGVTVALGSDGCSGNAISILEQAKFSMLLSRISQPDCERWITAPQALRMATANGGTAIGAPESLGTIRIGAIADLAIFDMSDRMHHPMGDIWNHLVMYESGRAVDTVFVAGELALRNGRCTQVNEADIYAVAEELAARDHSDNASHLARAFCERHAYQSLILEVLQQDTTPNRFARLT